MVSLSNDRGIKIKHEKLLIDTFIISIIEENFSVSKKALIILIQFSNSYLNEQEISSFIHIKCKIEKKVCVLKRKKKRICLYHVRPNFESVAKNIKHVFLIDKYS